MIDTGMFFLFACAETVDIEVVPEILDLGEVDILPDMPDDGYYASGIVRLKNDGETTVSLQLPEYDTTSLCIQGFLTQEFPVPMTELEPGQRFAITVGICGYPAGQDGQPTSASFDVWTGGDPDTVEVAVTFVPNQLTE